MLAWQKLHSAPDGQSLPCRPGPLPDPHMSEAETPGHRKGSHPPLVAGHSRDLGGDPGLFGRVLEDLSVGQVEGQVTG